MGGSPPLRLLLRHSRLRTGPPSPHISRVALLQCLAPCAPRVAACPVLTRLPLHAPPWFVPYVLRPELSVPLVGPRRRVRPVQRLPGVPAAQQGGDALGFTRDHLGGAGGVWEGWSGIMGCWEGTRVLGGSRELGSARMGLGESCSTQYALVGVYGAEER